MPDGLNIAVSWTDWGTVVGDAAAAQIAIHVAGQNACRVENRWAGAVHDSVHLSARPLALWFAASWWRLRWEAGPMPRHRALDWRMAHEMGAAGGGFLWPDLRMVSDGGSITVDCRPTDRASTEMLHYLSLFSLPVGAAAFELGVDQFIDRVVERLQGSDDGGLGELQATLRAERADPATARYRMIEARLGFDPDEAPADAIERVLALASRAGEGAMAEIASIGSGEAPDAVLAKVIQVVEGAAVEGRFAPVLVQDLPSAGTAPAEQGRILAQRLRQQMALSAVAPLRDDVLEDLLGLRHGTLDGVQRTSGSPGLSLAVARDGGGAGARFVFRRNRASGRRFEAARLMADHVFHHADSWHPATDADTLRQKQQRGFAAELLAPIEGLTGYLDGDYSRDAIEGAAEYFDVSSYTVGGQLANHRLVPRNHPAVPH